MRKLNIVVVGRSGVGKSSFLNYAAGKKVFETGIGEPVTQKYFEQIDIKKDKSDIIYSLFDTKGLEAGNTKEWIEAINQEIDRRDLSTNIYNWLHTIIYCIDASSKRIQPFEVESIKRLMSKGSVLVLLTKKDLVTPETIKELQAQILKDIGDRVQVLSVCSISQRTRKGESKAEGLEDVLKVSFLGLWEKASKVLPMRIAQPIYNIETYMTVSTKFSDFLALVALSRQQSNEDLLQYPHRFDSNIDHAVWDSNKELNYAQILKLEKIYTCLPFIITKAGGINKIRIDINSPFYCFFDKHYELSHYSLDDSYYSSSLISYIDLLIEILNKTINNFINGKKYLGEIEKDKNVVKDILEFYNEVNGSQRRVLKNHKTKDAIQKLLDVDYKDILVKGERIASKLKSSIMEVQSCFIFSGDERREVEKRFVAFQKYLQDQSDNIKDLLDEFVQCYQAELHAYGQYCIRKDELYNDVEEDNDNSELLKAIIKEALTDGKISKKERKMIEKVAKSINYPLDHLDQLINQIRVNKII